MGGAGCSAHVTELTANYRSNVSSAPGSPRVLAALSFVTQAIPVTVTTLISFASFPPSYRRINKVFVRRVWQSLCALII